MNILLKSLLISVGLPALICTALLGFGLKLQSAKIKTCIVSIAIGLGYLVAHIGIIGMPSFPPRESTQWLFIIALIAVAFGSLAALEPKFRNSGLFLTSFGVPLALLRSPMMNQWARAESIIILCIFGVSTLFLWLVLRWATPSEGTSVIPFVWLFVTGGLALALGWSGSASLAQLLGALATGLGVWLAFSMLGKQFSSDAILPLLIAMFSAFWVVAWYYIEVPMVTLILLTVAPLGLVFLKVGPGSNKPALRLLLTCGVPLLFVLLALYFAQPEPTAAGANSYY